MNQTNDRYIHFDLNQYRICIQATADQLGTDTIDVMDYIRSVIGEGLLFRINRNSVITKQAREDGSISYPEFIQNACSSQPKPKDKPPPKFMTEEE